MTRPAQINAFWREAGPSAWFKKSDAFDRSIRERFGDTYEDAITGKLDGWAKDAPGLLALVIVLDQFSRNLFRDDARAYAHDDKALALTRKALANGWVADLLADDATREIAVFAAMPLMHSESIRDQQDCAAVMMRPDWADNFRFALVHRDIVARFGRFPHRNPVLGRHTSAAERTFLEEGGFRG